MRRISLFAAIALGAGFAAATAEEQAPAGEAEAALHQLQRDGFVISNDACGASAYDHLLGENFAEMYQASLIPANSGAIDATTLTTLEYTPGQINFVVGEAGQIIAVGCF